MVTLDQPTTASIREALAERALCVIDAAYTNARSVMTEVEAPKIFLRTDHRVVESVLFLAAMGYKNDSCPSLQLDFRLNDVEWESLLMHSLGQYLFSINKEFKPCYNTLPTPSTE